MTALPMQAQHAQGSEARRPMDQTAIDFALFREVWFDFSTQQNAVDPLNDLRL